MQLEKKPTIRKAEETDLLLLKELIKCMATYEKRPEDMTATNESLNYWLFERKIATALIIEHENKAIGYAIYYPTFGSFAAVGSVHLEDLFIKKEYRNHGFGTYIFSNIVKRVKEEGYSKMEWSCLDWNTPSIGFYEKLGADYETGRKYFEYSLENMK